MVPAWSPPSVHHLLTRWIHLQSDNYLLEAVGLLGWRGPGVYWKITSHIFCKVWECYRHVEFNGNHDSSPVPLLVIGWHYIFKLDLKWTWNGKPSCVFLNNYSSVSKCLTVFRLWTIHSCVLLFCLFLSISVLFIYLLSIEYLIKCNSSTF